MLSYSVLQPMECHLRHTGFVLWLLSLYKEQKFTLIIYKSVLYQYCKPKSAFKLWWLHTKWELKLEILHKLGWKSYGEREKHIVNKIFCGITVWPLPSISLPLIPFSAWLHFRWPHGTLVVDLVVVFIWAFQWVGGRWVHVLLGF